jgi:hypothetical protein
MPSDNNNSVTSDHPRCKHCGCAIYPDQNPLTDHYDHVAESDPNNSVPSATVLMFEEWARTAYHGGAYAWGPLVASREGWNARQPEIDALRERERRLRDMLGELEWLSPSVYGQAGLMCVVCGSLKPYHCGNCKLAGLLAAKEGSANG